MKRFMLMLVAMVGALFSASFGGNKGGKASDLTAVKKGKASPLRFTKGKKGTPELKAGKGRLTETTKKAMDRRTNVKGGGTTARGKVGGPNTPKVAPTRKPRRKK